MTRRSCDGAGLLAAYRGAVANLEAHVDEINGLNVYPVPDGDTGSNMAATVRSALEEAEHVADQPADRIAAAISFGALMGARGNSGVIASQIFRGMAEGLGGKRRFNGLDLAHALSEGSRTAYAAVAKPVEGTILTVINAASTAAVEAAERDRDIGTVLGAVVEAAREAVARTPSLLAILREAGVVDAGGQGLYRLFEGAWNSVRATETTAVRPAAAAAARAATVAAHADEGYGYETMYLLQARSGAALDVDALRRHLESIGESVLVAGDARAVKVHVHSERPDEVIAYGLTLGPLSRISVENLDQQAHDVREARATEFTATSGTATVAATPVAASTNGRRPGRADRVPIEAVPAAVGAGVVGAPAASQPVQAPSRAPSVIAEPPAVEPDTVGPAVVAVVAGEGLARIFEEFGVDQVIRGGQSANPSTGELLRVARLARAREVLLLPNNANVRLAAEQAAKLCDDRRIVVIPTRNAAEGLAAVLALDPALDAGANEGPMTEAGRGLRTLVVTEAVRDAQIGSRKVKRGQTIVLDPDDGLVAVDGRPDAAVLTAIGTLEPGFELVTIYYGEDATLADTERLSRLIAGTANGVEVEVVHGGQPHYRYLISAE